MIAEFFRTKSSTLSLAILCFVLLPLPLVAQTILLKGRITDPQEECSSQCHGQTARP